MKRFSIILTILLLTMLAIVGQKIIAGWRTPACVNNLSPADCTETITPEVHASPSEAPNATPTTTVYLPTVTNPPGPFNLMPMGDSLVEGWYWVPELFYDHKDHCEFWMVGSNEGDNVWTPSREGHGGATTSDYLAQQWHTTATANYDPDVILLMLGTNDYSNPSANPTVVAERLQQIVDQIHAVKQTVTIVVAIVPRADADMKAYDAALQTMSDVTYIDQFSGFNPATMTDDGVHPNKTGSQLMADRYYTALRSLGYCP